MKKISRCNCLLKGSIEIPYRPAENLKSEIVFVFESPGKTEIEKGMMLIGASYKRLKSICDEVGLDLSKVFLANAARCKIDKDRFSQGQINKILEACRPKLKTALECSPRKLIVCFGEIAFRQVMRVKTTLKKARNNFYWNKEFNCWVYCTYHPAATLYYPNYLPLLKTDLRKVKEFIESGYKQEETIKWKEVDSIRPLLDDGFYRDESGCYVTAIDTETQGTAWYDPNSITISYSVAASPNEGWNVVLYEEVEKDKGDFNILVKRGGTKKKPIYVEVGIKKCQNFDTKVAELKELVARKDIKKYFMNIKYELHRFKNLGINEWNNCCFDVKVAAHVLDSELYKDVNLEELITLFTNIPMNHKDLVTDAEKEDMLTLLTNDRDRFNKYAALDAAATLQVGLNIRKELLKDKRSTNYYVKLAHPIESELLFEIERNGVCIDRERVWKIKKLIKEEMKKAELECIKYCPKTVYERHKKNFKLSRGIIVREVLFKWTDKLLRKNQEKPEVHDYGFNLEPILVSKKNGEPLIDKKKVLIPILQGNYPKKVKKFVQAYLNWGEYNKLLTNYIPNIEELSKYDGRLHPSASITFTSSGRTGFRKPALQTIPKRSKSAKYIRMLFKATSDEYVLVEADYKVSELRWVAHVADDKQFQRIFKEGKDPHVITGLSIKGLPENYKFKSKQERKELRQGSKCFHPDVEILTKKGWVKLKDYDGTSELMQARIDENSFGVKLEWTKPLFFEIRKNHCDTLVHLFNEGMDIKVTPDHDLLGITKAGNIKRYKPHLLTRARYIYNSGVLIDTLKTENEQFLRLAVAVQADGSFNRSKDGNIIAIRFGFKKERKVLRLRELLKGIPYKETFKRGVYSFYISDMNCISNIMKHLDNDKTFKWNLIHYSLQDRLVILDELLYWDGTRLDNWRSFHCSTTKKKNIDIVQTIATISGFKTSVRKVLPQKPHHNPVWEISIKDHSYSRGGNISIVERPYNGNVATLVVPSHIVLVRYRGKTLITYQCCNFGLIYGMMPPTLKSYSEINYGVKMTLKQAEEFREKWFSFYRQIPDWHRKSRYFLEKHGYLRSVFGRIRRLPKIYSEDKWVREQAFRTGINFEIQGPSSDATLLGGLNLLRDKSIKREDCRIVLFIHDALIFEVKKDKLKEILPKIKYYMENIPTEQFGFKLKVPLEIEIEVGDNLSEMEEVKI